MILIENLSKDYRDGETVVHALRNVNLEITGGEFLSLAGPSGSGKTTLLNLIGCLDSPTRGEISLDGQPLSGWTPRQLSDLRRERIGFVFQSFNLIPVLSAAENVSFALSLLDLPEREIQDRTMQILSEVGLGGLEHRRPAELSGGQQQRVAIARALVKRPALVLADEPTANLDSKTGEEILHLMEELNSRYGTTFVFSTHDRMVMEFAHRLVNLLDGSVVADERTVRSGI